MKLTLVLTATFAAAFMLMAADPVTYMDHATVAKAMVKGGSIAKGSDHTVSANHRDKAGEVEVHDKETDVIYITEGEATVVTGGTMIGGKDTTPGQHRGTDVKGGVTRHVSPGDVFVIPAGTPHWFKEVPKSVSYFTVKIIKP